jgi:hypothetical protein
MTSPLPVEVSVNLAPQASVQTTPQLIAALSALERAQLRLRTAIRDAGNATATQVRAMRPRVRTLMGRVQRAAVSARRAAIAQAKAGADGAWAIVNRAGGVVAQSGGVTVTQVRPGTYAVDVTASASCLSAGAAGSIQVAGPVATGFFLAIGC